MKVLIVDDDPISRMVLTEMVSQLPNAEIVEVAESPFSPPPFAVKPYNLQAVDTPRKSGKELRRERRKKSRR